MVERQHRMGFAATKVGLQLYHRITTPLCHASHGTNQHLLQTFGQISTAEKLNRVTILIGTFTKMHLPEVGGKLSLLVTATGHIVMRHNYLPPRLEHTGHPGFERNTRRFSALSPRLLIKAETQQLHLRPLHLITLRCRDSSKQAANGVQCAIGIIAGKKFLMGPFVAAVTNFRHKATFRKTQCIAEHVVP